MDFAGCLSKLIAIVQLIHVVIIVLDCQGLDWTRVGVKPVL